MKVKQKREEEREAEKEKQKEKRAQEKEEKAKKKQKAEDKKKEMKEPKFLSYIISLAGGLKLEIKRLHFRYEDDYFQHHKPFSFGFMIDSITMDNSESDWHFDSPVSMAFYRKPPQ